MHIDLDGIALAREGRVAIAQQLEQPIVELHIAMFLHTIINSKHPFFQAAIQGEEIHVRINAHEILLFQTVGKLSQIDGSRAAICIEIEEVVIAQGSVLHIQAYVAHQQRHHALVWQIRSGIGLHLIRVHPHKIDRRNLLSLHSSDGKNGHHQGKILI